MSKKPAKGKTQAWPKEQTRDAARLRSAIAQLLTLSRKRNHAGKLGRLLYQTPRHHTRYTIRELILLSTTAVH
jgi:hypothetical protein